MTADTKNHGNSVDEILATSWDRKLAKDLAEEIGSCTGNKLGTVLEMRRFLALKGYRELLQLLREAREGKNSDDALAAVARAMRRYAHDRPALSAAAFQTATVDCPEWREAHERLHTFMLDTFAGCSLFGEAAENALNMLRSLVRGYVLHEVMHTLVGVESYDDAFDKAIQVFAAGLPAFASGGPGRPRPQPSGSVEQENLPACGFGPA